MSNPVSKANATANETLAAPEKIEPLFADAFVRIFGKEESKGVTRSLINSVLEHVGVEPIGNIERIDAEHALPEGGVECKTPRFDVQVSVGRRLVDLEAQRYPTDIGSRSAYYAANALVSATGKDVSSYTDLPQAIVITLLDDPSPFPDSPDFVHMCDWCWHVDGEVVRATDCQLVVLVELDKVRKRYNSLSEEVLDDKLLAWGYLVTKGFRDESEVDMIAATYPDIEEFAELYGLAVSDPKVVRAFRDAQSAVLEYNNRQEYFAKLEREAQQRGLEEGRTAGRAEGRAAGRAEGRAEGMAENVRNLMESIGCDASAAMGMLKFSEEDRRLVEPLL